MAGSNSTATTPAPDEIDEFEEWAKAPTRTDQLCECGWSQQGIEFEELLEVCPICGHCFIDPDEVF
jgi:hypothetical protein